MYTGIVLFQDPVRALHKHIVFVQPNLITGYVPLFGRRPERCIGPVPARACGLIQFYTVKRNLNDIFLLDPFRASGGQNSRSLCPISGFVAGKNHSGGTAHQFCFSLQERYPLQHGKVRFLLILFKKCLAHLGSKYICPFLLLKGNAVHPERKQRLQLRHFTKDMEFRYTQEPVRPAVTLSGIIELNIAVRHIRILRFYHDGLQIIGISGTIRYGYPVRTVNGRIHPHAVGPGPESLSRLQGIMIQFDSHTLIEINGKIRFIIILVMAPFNKGIRIAVHNILYIRQYSFLILRVSAVQITEPAEPEVLRILDIIDFPVLPGRNHHNQRIRCRFQFLKGFFHLLCISAAGQRSRRIQGRFISMHTGLGIGLGFIIPSNLLYHVLQTAAHHQIPLYHSPGMAVICDQSSLYFTCAGDTEADFSVRAGVVLIQDNPGCHRIVIKIKGLQ